MSLWKYSMLNLFQLGNEHSLIHGTFISEANLERLKGALVADFTEKDSSMKSQTIQLTNFFYALIQSYSLKTT